MCALYELMDIDTFHSHDNIMYIAICMSYISRAAFICLCSNTASKTNLGGAWHWECRYCPQNTKTKNSKQVENATNIIFARMCSSQFTSAINLFFSTTPCAYMYLPPVVRLLYQSCHVLPQLCLLELSTGKGHQVHS